MLLMYLTGLLRNLDNEMNCGFDLLELKFAECSELGDSVREAG